MNYSDFPDLQTDDFCGTRFGASGQLEVVGHNMKTGNSRRYIVLCHTCSQDKELYGDGVFASAKHTLTGGGIPCGCNPIYNFDARQWVVLVKRNLPAPYCVMDFTIVAGKDRGQARCTCSCPIHGEWSTSARYVRRGSGCPACASTTNSRNRAFPHEEWDKKFRATGHFKPEDRFVQLSSDRWEVYCSVCKTTNKQRGVYLLTGHKACNCTGWRCVEAYVHRITDESGPVAVKFGVASDTVRRVKQQNKKAILGVESHSVFRFSTPRECKAAERECKQTLECGIISKSDMPDGWTETTYCYNIEAIEAIYRKHGGVRI